MRSGNRGCVSVLKVQRFSCISALLLVFAAAISGCGGSTSGGGGTPSNVATVAISATTAAPTFGVSDTITFNVTGNSTVPTGTVSYSYTAPGSATATTGTMTLPANTLALPALSVGSYVFSAQYSGDSNYHAATAPGYTLSVAKGSLSLSLTPATSPVTALSLSEAITVGVSGAPTGLAQPTGSVSYSYTPPGATTDTTGTLALPADSFTISNLAQGTYNLSSTYAGDANYSTATASTSLTVGPPPAPDVLTRQYDNARSNVQQNEVILSPTNVNSSSFGKLFTLSTNGDTVYALPLYVSQYTMSDNKQHNVLFVAAVGGVLTAFDADGSNGASGYIWSKSLVPSGEVAVPYQDNNCNYPSPTSTLVGTPVIDRAAGLLYVVLRTKKVVGSSTTYIQRLHAVKLSDGSEQQGGPVVIQGSVPGAGDGSSNGVLPFSPQSANQRAALTLANGTVWIAWGAFCDNRVPAYRGWLMGYDSTTLKQTAIWSSSPYQDTGGIWMSGSGISVDENGDLYFAVGNGGFSVNSGGVGYGTCAVHLKVNPGAATPQEGVSVVDWFSPSDNGILENNDQDLGMMGMLLISDPGHFVPNLAITADKSGRIYLLNRDNLGKYVRNGPNDDVQDFTNAMTPPNSMGIWRVVSYYQGKLYIGVTGAPLQAFDFVPGNNTTAGYFNTTVNSVSPEQYVGKYNQGGTSPSISTRGGAYGTGLIWAIDQTADQKTQILRVYNSLNISQEYYNSTQAANNRDQALPPVVMVSPVVANGHVYVAGVGGVTVYGLLPK